MVKVNDTFTILTRQQDWLPFEKYKLLTSLAGCQEVSSDIYDQTKIILKGLFTQEDIEAVLGANKFSLSIVNKEDLKN